MTGRAGACLKGVKRRCALDSCSCGVEADADAVRRVPQTAHDFDRASTSLPGVRHITLTQSLLLTPLPSWCHPNSVQVHCFLEQWQRFLAACAVGLLALHADAGRAVGGGDLHRGHDVRRAGQRIRLAAPRVGAPRGAGGGARTRAARALPFWLRRHRLELHFQLHGRPSRRLPHPLLGLQRCGSTPANPF